MWNSNIYTSGGIYWGNIHVTCWTCWFSMLGWLNDWTDKLNGHIGNGNGCWCNKKKGKRWHSTPKSKCFFVLKMKITRMAQTNTKCTPNKPRATYALVFQAPTRSVGAASSPAHLPWSTSFCRISISSMSVSPSLFKIPSSSTRKSQLLIDWSRQAYTDTH